MKQLIKIIFYTIVLQALNMFTHFNPVFAQPSALVELSEAKLKFDEAYGVDYDLVNGKKYVNFYASASGHAFLNSPDFESGWLNIKGKVFDNQIVNYDIYNQEVIAEHKSDLIGVQRYILAGIFLEAFGMGQREFTKLKIGERKERFYELISNDRDSLLLTHDKRYSINRNFNSRGFLFSETITKKYLLRDNDLIRFKNNKSFRHLFNSGIQDDIKSYMKTYRINIRKADALSLKRLFNYISTLN